VTKQKVTGGRKEPVHVTKQGNKFKDDGWGMWHAWESIQKWFLLATPEGKRPLERPTHRWNNNIASILREIKWKGWINLAKDRYMSLTECNSGTTKKFPTLS
jgi:hypothetical protein